MRALVIAHAPVGAQLAGPAIRSAEFARALARAGFDVTLAGERGQGEPELAAAGADGAGVRFLPYARHAPRALREPIAAADVVVTQPPWPGVAAWLRGSDARTIVDLYDPEPLEVLEFLRGRRAAVRRTVTALSLDRLANALHLAHGFLCASERQRDLWTGTILSQRLLVPDLAELFAVVPFGVEDEPPAPGPGPRERFGLADDDEIVLWNGGLWAWLDPETALRAIARLAERRPGVRLVFMGASGDAQARAATAAARRLAGELGILDTVALFNDEWVPHAQRGGWLLQAACALSTQADHLETRYAFRTRLLDCFWAGVPVVCTEGDELAARVAADGLGVTVPPGDVDALTDALERVLDAGRGTFSSALAGAADELRWSRVCEPLVALASGSSAGRPRGKRSQSLGERAGRAKPALPVRARNAVYRAASGALGVTRLGDRVRLR